MSNGVPDPFTMEPKRYGNCVFTRQEAEGAIPNGTVIRKCDAEEGDGHPIGAMGVVIGSLAADPRNELPTSKLLEMEPRFRDSQFAYFIEWRGEPHMVTGIIAPKIETVE